MSIKINRDKCQRCGKCIEVCPGNLLYLDQSGTAQIREPRDCWGCAACLKECRFAAIQYFLAPDIGGLGTYMYTQSSPNLLYWHFVNPQGEEKIITLNRREANRY